MRILASRRVLALVLAATLTSCGGGGGTPTPTPAPTVAPPTPPPVADNWAAVKTELNNFSVANAGIIVGNASGVRLRYEKGAFKLTDRHFIASSSKMMAGLTILKMIDDGQMALTDNPQKYLPYWTSTASDPRSKVTLAQLLAFTSGFDRLDAPSNCVNNAATTLQACAQDYYNKGLTYAPGTNFAYGSAHLEVAGAMAEIAGGKPFAQLYRDKVANPLAMGAVSGFTYPSAANPLIAGGAVSTGEEYAKMLDGVMTNRLLSTNGLATFKRDQTTNVTFAFRPGASSTTDWHYAAASWYECDFAPFDARCANAHVISSPGLFGWTPWIDFDNGYYAIITMEGLNTLDSSGVSVALEQRLQPLIVAALAAGG
jgi:serine-type D-Ala-D-Ala carboxypeptidase/endopeptidase